MRFRFIALLWCLAASFTSPEVFAGVRSEAIQIPEELLDELSTLASHLTTALDDSSTTFVDAKRFGASLRSGHAAFVLVGDAVSDEQSPLENERISPAKPVWTLGFTAGSRWRAGGFAIGRAGTRELRYQDGDGFEEFSWIHRTERERIGGGITLGWHSQTTATWMTAEAFRDYRNDARGEAGVFEARGWGETSYRVSGRAELEYGGIRWNVGARLSSLGVPGWNLRFVSPEQTLDLPASSPALADDFLGCSGTIGFGRAAPGVQAVTEPDQSYGDDRHQPSRGVSQRPARFDITVATWLSRREIAWIGPATCIDGPCPGYIRSIDRTEDLNAAIGCELQAGRGFTARMGLSIQRRSTEGTTQLTWIDSQGMRDTRTVTRKTRWVDDFSMGLAYERAHVRVAGAVDRSFQLLRPFETVEIALFW